MHDLQKQPTIYFLLFPVKGQAPFSFCHIPLQIIKTAYNDEQGVPLAEPLSNVISSDLNYLKSTY